MASRLAGSIRICVQLFMLGLPSSMELGHSKSGSLMQADMTGLERASTKARALMIGEIMIMFRYRRRVLSPVGGLCSLFSRSLSIDNLKMVSCCTVCETIMAIEAEMVHTHLVE